MLQETGEHDLWSAHCLSQREVDATSAAKICSVNLLLVYKNNFGIYPLLRETCGGPTDKDDFMLPPMQCTPIIFDGLGRDVLRIGCIAVIETESGKSIINK